MKKIFLTVLLIAVSAASGYSRDVRVLLKAGGEHKGELSVTDESSVSLKLENGRVRKFYYADIDSVIDEATGKDILGSIGAEGRAAGKKVSAGRSPADSPAARTARKALPDNVMGWMAQRYNAKTLLGFKWEHPDKARIHYAFEKNNYGPSTGYLAKSSAGRTPAGRLDIIPVSSFYDSAALDNKTNSYLELRYSKAGAGASWNIGYMKYSETRHDDVFEYSYTGVVSDLTSGDKYRKTDAGVVYASLVLALPAQGFSFYGYGGPAFVSYDYSESGTFIKDHYVWLPYSHTATPGAYAVTKSATVATWIAGFGGALRLSDSGFGVFGEYKHIPSGGTFAGVDNLGLGLSFGF